MFYSGRVLNVLSPDQFPAYNILYFSETYSYYMHSVQSSDFALFHEVDYNAFSESQSNHCNL